MFSWIVGSVPILLGVLIGSFSWFRLYINWSNHKKGIKEWSSPIPIVGSLMFFVGYGLLPIEHNLWVLLFLLYDFDTLYTIFAFPYAMYLDFVKKETSSNS
jgi:hypothetical protein